MLLDPQSSAYSMQKHVPCKTTMHEDMHGLFRKSSFTNARVAKDLNHCRSPDDSRWRRMLFRIRLNCYILLYYLYTVLLQTLRLEDLLVLAFSTLLTYVFYKV